MHVVLASQDPVKSLLPDLSSVGTTLTGCVGDVETIISSLLNSSALNTLLSPLNTLLNTLLTLVNQVLAGIAKILSKL